MRHSKGAPGVQTHPESAAVARADRRRRIADRRGARGRRGPVRVGRHRYRRRRRQPAVRRGPGRELGHQRHGDRPELHPGPAGRRGVRPQGRDPAGQRQRPVRHVHHPGGDQLDRLPLQHPGQLQRLGLHCPAVALHQRDQAERLHPDQRLQLVLRQLPVHQHAGQRPAPLLRRGAPAVRHHLSGRDHLQAPGRLGRQRLLLHGRLRRLRAGRRGPDPARGLGLGDQRGRRRQRRGRLDQRLQRRHHRGRRRAARSGSRRATTTSPATSWSTTSRSPARACGTRP